MEEGSQGLLRYVAGRCPRHEHAYRDCYLDLDPTYRDTHGQPLLRMTFDYDNDIRMSRHVVGAIRN